MGKSYTPAKNAELVTWAANITSIVASAPTAVGLTTAQSTSLSSANTLLASTWTTASAPITRTKTTIHNFQNAKKAFLATVRPLVKIIQGFPALTDGQRASLGITIHAPVTPIGVPTEQPSMEVVSVKGRTLNMKVHSSTTDRKKPVGAAGASVWTFIGATPPADLNLWVSQGSTTRTIFAIVFPASVPAGSQVWLAASWFNPRNQTGPACEPITAYIAGGVTKAA